MLAVPASPGDDQLITSGAASEKLGKWAGASWSLELNSHLMPPPQVICGRQVCGNSIQSGAVVGHASRRYLPPARRLRAKRDASCLSERRLVLVKPETG